MLFPFQAHFLLIFKRKHPSHNLLTLLPCFWLLLFLSYLPPLNLTIQLIFLPLFQLSPGGPLISVSFLPLKFSFLSSLYPPPPPSPPPPCNSIAFSGDLPQATERTRSPLTFSRKSPANFLLVQAATQHTIKQHPAPPITTSYNSQIFKTVFEYSPLHVSFSYYTFSPLM